LKDPSPYIRKAVVLALAQIGPGAAPAVGPLKVLLLDEDPEVRLAAQEALGRIGTPEALAAQSSFNATVSEQLIPEQIKNLSSNDAGWSATQALAKIGPPVVPALCGALEGPNLTASFWASNALSQIAKEHPTDPVWSTVIPCLRAGVQSSYPGIQAQMADAISALRVPEAQGIAQDYQARQALKNKYLAPYYALKMGFLKCWNSVSLRIRSWFWHLFS
jgi:HEAT repeat protein